MRVTKNLLKLDAKLDEIRHERDQYKSAEYLNALLDFNEALDAKLVGKCFIWKWNCSKEKCDWEYVKFLDRNEENCLRSIKFPYIFDREELGAVSFSVDYIRVRGLKELKPISEEKFQSKLVDALEIILSATKRKSNGTD